MESQIKRLAATFILIFAGVSSAQVSPAGQLQYVGISSQQINYVATQQRNSNWCWAASIQMVLNYYGVNIAQEEIVARTYGTDPYGQLPNFAANAQSITKNLNNWNVDRNGRSYMVSAAVIEGMPAPNLLLQELSQGHPIIVAYQNGSSGHAVVITAASYIPTPNGANVQSIVVRDPWPSGQNAVSGGRIEYRAASFMPLVNAFWIVRVF